MGDLWLSVDYIPFICSHNGNLGGGSSKVPMMKPSVSYISSEKWSIWSNLKKMILIENRKLLTGKKKTKIRIEKLRWPMLVNIGSKSSWNDAKTRMEEGSLYMGQYNSTQLPVWWKVLFAAILKMQYFPRVCNHWNFKCQVIRTTCLGRIGRALKRARPRLVSALKIPSVPGFDPLTFGLQEWIVNLVITVALWNK